MKIIPGPASKELGEGIAKHSNLGIVPLSLRVFPDGESYIRLEGNVENEKVAIVQTTSPPQDTRLVQLALIADAAKRNGATKVTAVIPYLAYARQDKVFLQGESLSIDAIARMLKAAGIDSLLTVNMHQERILTKFPFPAKTVSAIPLLAEYFKQKDLGRTFIVSPDQGAIHIAEEAKKVLGAECGYLEKKRDRHTGQVRMENRILDVRDKTTIIFDDIISSGGTIVEAARILEGLGAKKILVACVHPLLIGDAEKRIFQSGVEEIVGTDSVPSHVSKISLAPLLSKALT